MMRRIARGLARFGLGIFLLGAVLGQAGAARAEEAGCSGRRVTLCACAASPLCTKDAAFSIRIDGTQDYLPLPRLELARTPDERAQGLMGRAPLDDDQAMLFIYPDEAPRAFWMKNTPSPLDIVFLDARGGIVSIRAAAIPFDETPISSMAPARYVLELGTGRAAALGLRVGGRLVLERGGEGFWRP